MSVGVGVSMEKPLVGRVKIKSRGLSVFVESEEIVIYEGKWKNSAGVFDTLEKAIKDAVLRHEGS
jgi:hypothetical protein